MIKFFKNYKRNQGMTYVELIVVLSIFASLSTVVMFNYNEFQERIDIKNLSSDIALKVVEAQKSSISGRLPPSQPVGGQNWKPSYGVYLNPATDNEFFYYFTDINQNCIDPLLDTSSVCMDEDESLEQIILPKGNIIDGLSFLDRGDTSPDDLQGLTDLTISFVRPSGSAIFRSTDTSFDPDNVDYVQITVKSPKDTTANIKIYSSGNIDIR